MLETGTDPLDKTLGAVVRLRDETLRPSQTGLAETIGVTFRQVQTYEQGTNRVSFSTMTRIADALGRRSSELTADLKAPGAFEADRGAAKPLAQPGAADPLEAFREIRSRALRQAVRDLARKLAAVE